MIEYTPITPGLIEKIKAIGYKYLLFLEHRPVEQSYSTDGNKIEFEVVSFFDHANHGVKNSKMFAIDSDEANALLWNERIYYVNMPSEYERHIPLKSDGLKDSIKESGLKHLILGKQVTAKDLKIHETFLANRLFYEVFLTDEMGGMESGWKIVPVGSNEFDRLFADTPDSYLLRPFKGI